MKLLLLLTTALFSGPAAAQQVAVETVVSRQPALGLKSSQFTAESAVGVERQMLDRVRLNATKRLGGSASAERAAEQAYEASSVVLEIGEDRFIVTKLKVGMHKPVLQVSGIRDDEFIRVLCMVDADADVSLIGNDCERVVERTFGIIIPGGSING